MKKKFTKLYKTIVIKNSWKNKENISVFLIEIESISTFINAYEDAKNCSID